MNNLKQKFNQTDRHDEKIQILTLKPNSRTIQETINFFGATSYQVREANDLTSISGILSKPTRNKRPGIPQETIELVQSFYANEEYSREMPDSKVYVSFGYKLHKQKRLLLCNLSELYAEFKMKHPDQKIGFSKFCTKRSKWSKNLGSFGSHSAAFAHYTKTRF